MGLRFRKSIKLAPGVRLNLGRKSTSVSFGGKGMRHTISSTGRRTTSVGIPGTGLSYSHTHGRKKTTKNTSTSTRQGGNMKKQKSPTICKNCGAELSSKAKVCRYCRTKVKKPAHKKWWVWLLVLALLGSCIGKNEEPAEQKDSFENSADAVISDNTPIEENEPEEVPLFVTPEVPEETETPINETPVENQPVVEEVPEVVPPVVETPVREEPVEVTVYITNTGSKYHRGGCRFLDESKIPISLSDAQAMYEPCGTCDP